MLADMLIQVPGVQQFLNALLEDFSDRRSHLVLLPIGVEALDLWHAMEGYLFHKGVHVEEVSLPSLPDNASPAGALGQTLNIKWPRPTSPRSIENLMISEGLPDVIHLRGFDELSEFAVRKTWLTFMSEWAQISQNLSDHAPPSLSLFAPGSTLPAKVPESNVRLSVHHWWGFPSALEVQLLCRLENASGERSPHHRWREHLIPAIAGNDIALARHLWNHPNLDSTQLPSLLQKFGDQYGWTRQHLHDWDVDDFLLISTHNEVPPSSPPLRGYQLWAHGALNWTPEYGLELHAAALALLGRTEDLQHRLWRGQTSLLFPLIDNVRLAICRYLSRRYEKGWPVWLLPQDENEAYAVQDNPLACQWGHLARLINHCGLLRKERILRPVVNLTWQIRNELAHYRPIPLSDFSKLWGELHQLQQKIKVNVSA